jgi:hypothetical protein
MRLQAALHLIDSELLTILREAGYSAGKAYAEQLWQNSPH